MRSASRSTCTRYVTRRARRRTPDTPHVAGMAQAWRRHGAGMAQAWRRHGGGMAVARRRRDNRRCSTTVRRVFVHTTQARKKRCLLTPPTPGKLYQLSPLPSKYLHSGAHAQYDSIIITYRVKGKRHCYAQVFAWKNRCPAGVLLYICSGFCFLSHFGYHCSMKAWSSSGCTKSEVFFVRLPFVHHNFEHANSR